MPELSPECIATPAPPPIPPDSPPVPPEPPQREPTPPAGDPPPNFWEDRAVFREVFLAYVTEPDLNAALRTVGRHVFDLVLEWDRLERTAESFVVAGLRAAAADLRVMEAYLFDLGNAHKASSLDAEEARLSRRAEAWTRQLRRLVAAVETALPPREVPS